MKLECPSGKTVETQIRNVKRYIASQVGRIYTDARHDGKTDIEATEEALRWGNGTLSGVLKNLGNTAGAFVVADAEISDAAARGGWHHNA